MSPKKKNMSGQKRGTASRARTRPVRKQGARGGASPPSGESLGYDHHVDAIAGLSDPFCTHARGARLPDMGSGRTVTESCRQLATITTDANGDAGILFQPSPKYCQLPAARQVDGTFLAGNQYLPFGANSTSLERRARVVTWGVRAINLQSAVESKGQIVLFKVSRTQVTDVYGVNPSSYPCFEIHPLKHGGEWSLISYPTADTRLDWQSYDTMTNTTDVSTGAWEGMGIFILGSQATSSVLSLEIYFNTEYIPTDDNPLCQFALPQPVYNPQLFVATNQVHSTHNGLGAMAKDAIGKEIKKHALAAAKKHLIPALKKKGLEYGLAALAL